MPDKNQQELMRTFTNEGCPGEAFRPVYDRLTATLKLPAGMRALCSLLHVHPVNNSPAVHWKGSIFLGAHWRKKR